MRKLTKSFLSLLLIAAMLASFVVLPAAAEEPAAEQPTETVQAAETQAADSSFMKIFHLDCGRKYFTKDWILALINEISAAGYTHLQLAIGNDGMRFLLDDMSLTVGDKTYSSEDVAAAIHAGNEKYHDFDVDELTQKEMDEIIARAQEKNIEIIPLVNTPGHMDAILAAAASLTGSDCAYSRSARTIDVTNSTAVAFTQAFVQKYVDYFASKGCKYFNMGADEYANDVFTSGSMGFGNLQSAGKYSYYVTYVNDVAAMIKNAGMTPMAFNDGIYFANNTSSGTFDTDIVICYWSNGWSGYTPMASSTLAGKGFKLVNTNGSYYWVLGKSDAQCDVAKAKGFNNNGFADTTNSNSTGSMFCVWCDYPGAGTEQDIAKSVRLVLRAMAQRMKGESVVLDENELVSGGFKADGTINTDVDFAVDTATGIKVSAPGVKTVDVTAKTDNLPEVTGAAEVLAWEVTPRDANGNAYTGEGTVTLHIPEAWTGAKVYGAVVNEDGSITEGTNLTLDEKNHTITFTVPHFSTVLAVKENKSNTVDITIGDPPKTLKLDGNRIDGMGNPLLDNDIATVTGEYKHQKTGTTAEKLSSISAGDEFAISDGTNYLCLSGTSLSNTTKAEEATKWTWVTSNGGYLLKAVNDNTTKYYLTYSWRDGFKVTTNTTSYWNYSSSNGFNIDYYYQNYRIVYNSGWTATSYSSGTTGHPYRLTDVYTDNTILTITGKSAGTTTLTLGNETYTINVNYKQQQVNAVVGETTTIAVSGTPDTTGLDTTIAEVTIVNNKMTIKGLKEGNTSVRVGDTEYKINVRNIDLSTVTPLKIEYWITNSRLTGTTSSKNELSIAATLAGVASAEGVEIASLVDAQGAKDGRTQEYWQSKILDVQKSNDSTSGTELQTTKQGDDETLNGTAFTKARYWDGKWQVFTNAWVDVDRTQVTVTDTGDVPYKGDRNQLVAYYMEVVSINNENGESELHVNAADWGTKGDGTGSWGYPPESSRCSVSIQLVYEDGSFNPTDTTAAKLKSKTILYGYWSGGRGLGTMVFTGQQGYEIYKVTAETGNMTSTAASNYTVTVTNFTWDENEETVWEGDQTKSVSIGNPARKPSYEAPYDNLAWNTGAHNRNNAILIRVYVKAEIKEDSLKVHYVNLKGNSEFYTYAINVPEGTTFDSQLAMDPASETYLVHNTVVNTNGIQQTVNGNLSKMAEIGAQYRYGGFTLKEVKLKNGNKEAWLYYDFQNEHVFVVDFGVPVRIMPSDINVAQSGWSGAKVDGKETSVGKYGTATVGVGKGLTYTATKPMQGVETFTVTLEFTDSDNKITGLTYLIYLVPATTVYYEQNVATYSDGWNSLGTIAADKYQQTQKGRTTGYNFGYDSYYEANQLGANGSVEYTTTPGESAQLTFKGTGMELYLRTQNANATSDPATEANNATDHSYMLVQVYAGDTADANNLKRMSFVDVNNLFVAHGSDKYGYNTPCWTVDGMAYDTYTVVVRYVKGTTYGLAIDGFRVTNTLNPDNATTKDFYAAVHEDNMQTSEIRNMVLAQAKVSNAIFDMSDKMYRVGVNEVLDAVFDDKDVISGATIIDSNGTVDTNVTVDENLVNIGPKNEIYLKNGQAVVMQIPSTYSTVQVGMRSLTGTPVQYKINTEEKTMNSTVDMYYKVSLAEGKLVIQNVSGGILALTKLKVTGAGTTTNDVSVETTPEAIRYAMALMRGLEVPQFTDVPEGAWYHDYVYDLVYRSVVNGMTATTYEPEGKLTRAQFVKLLACSLADAETLKTYEGRHPFKDSEGHWAEAYIAWAKDKGIVEGVSATEFDPEAPITREQMATIFGRYALKQGIELPKSDNAAGSFPDADKISEYAREFVELMRIAGILNGYEDGTFRPQGNATRAEAAKLFSLFLSITDKLAK